MEEWLCQYRNMREYWRYTKQLLSFSVLHQKKCYLRDTPIEHRHSIQNRARNSFPQSDHKIAITSCSLRGTEKPGPGKAGFDTQIAPKTILKYRAIAKRLACDLFFALPGHSLPWSVSAANLLHPQWSLHL